MKSDLIRSISDPEHPLTLEELNVVEESKVKVRNTTGIYTYSHTHTHAHTRARAHTHTHTDDKHTELRYMHLYT